MCGITPTEDLGNRLDAKLLELHLRDENDSRGAVVDGGSVGGRDGSAVGDENRTDRLQLLNIQVLDFLIAVNLDGRLAPPATDVDGRNLGEDTRFGGGLRPLVGLDSIRVLRLAGKVMLLAAELSLKTHELLLAVGVPEAILLHTVDQSRVAILDTSPKVRKIVWCVGHALGTARNDNGCIAGDNGLGTKDYSLQARRADLVDCGADNVIREAGPESTLPGRGLTEAVLGILIRNQKIKLQRRGTYLAERTLPKKTSSTSAGLISGTRSTAALPAPVSCETPCKSEIIS